MKTFEILQYQNVAQRHEVSSFWKNDIDRLAWHRIGTNLHFVKHTGSEKGNKVVCILKKVRPHLKREKFSYKNPDFWLFLNKGTRSGDTWQQQAGWGISSLTPTSPHPRSWSLETSENASPIFKKKKRQSSGFQIPSPKKGIRGKGWAFSDICFPGNKTAQSQKYRLSLHHLTLGGQSWLILQSVLLVSTWEYSLLMGLRGKTSPTPSIWSIWNWAAHLAQLSTSHCVSSKNY